MVVMFLLHVYDNCHICLMFFLLIHSNACQTPDQLVSVINNLNRLLNTSLVNSLTQNQRYVLSCGMLTQGWDIESQTRGVWHKMLSTRNFMFAHKSYPFEITMCYGLFDHGVRLFSLVAFVLFWDEQINE